MGILAPLFFAGLAALSLPLVLHLIRRTPRGRQDFSSLMFLSASPPRLTRRSRLDQILLLAVRLAVLALLAFAFVRPFLRGLQSLALSDLPAQRVAVLLDTSASMRQTGLWKQAIAAVEKRVQALAPQDDAALFTFSDRLQCVVPFVSDGNSTRTTGREAILAQLRQLEPGWAAGDLGLALSTLASELDLPDDSQQVPGQSQIILVSDLQKGSRIDALQAFEWPENVKLETLSLAPGKSTNASLHLLVNEEDPSQEPRVRVTSAANSQSDQFFIAWAGGESAKTPGNKMAGNNMAGNNRADNETAVYVPAGQSRVVRLPREEKNLAANRIVLRGDDHDFDNTCYVVPPARQSIRLMYAGGDDAEDASGLQYYLRLAAASDPVRQIEFQPLLSVDGKNLLAAPRPQFVVTALAVPASMATALRQYVDEGGTLLAVLTDKAAAESILPMLDDVELADAASKHAVGQFALLGQIDLAHPMFAPFANPRYGDFTKIHFWEHRSLRLKPAAESHVVASFDDGEPWLIERSLGRGRLLVMTSSWRPADSQLALSSKFVSLIGSMLDQACGVTQPITGTVVGQRVTVARPSAAEQNFTLPDGRRSTLAADARQFTDTDLPGIYQIGEGNSALAFAVNVAPAESETSPLDLEQLSQFGVPLAGQVSAAERLDRLRHERDVELEGRQKIWQWLLVACLGMLIVETALAGRLSLSAPPNARIAT